MNEKRRLIAQIFNYLDLIETESNQSVINLIRGILYRL
jgi:hypothetical protein